MNNAPSQLAWIRTHLYPHALRYKWWLVTGTFISCAMAGLNYYNLQFIRQLFDERSYLDNFGNFFFLLAVIFGLVFAFNLMNWFQASLNSSMIVNINKDMIDDFYGRICGMPFLFFHVHSPGQLLTLLLNDITQITPLIPLVFIDVVKNVLVLAVVLFYLANIQWHVLLLYVVLGIGYLVVTNYFTLRIRKMLPEIQGTREAIHNKLIEYFQVINLLKIYDTKSVEKNKVKDLNGLLAVQNKRVIFLENTKNFLLEFLIVFVICVFVLAGYNLISHHIITAGKFVTILIATYLVNGYVRSLFDIYSKAQQTRVYLERLSKVFNNKWDSGNGEQHQSVGKGVSIVRPVHSIVFDKVHFTYDQNTILEDVSCTFESGGIIGITGESGFGKTTILNLILKLIYPSTGTITINGISVEDIDTSSYLQEISYLPQNSLLFNGTIAENIAFGEKQADRDKVIVSAKMANIHDFILATRQGYDTAITTGMSSISEGEKKRIEVARALYKDSSVIILDEPTANLDLKNKVAIIQVLKSIKKNKLVIIVSHDLSVLEQCDKIMLINNQKRVEVLSSYAAVYRHYSYNAEN